MEEFEGIAGKRRIEVASSMWNSWQKRGAKAEILTGFSGTGKTERIIRPLVSRARNKLRAPAVQIDVPANPTQLDQELLARLVTALADAGASELAAEAYDSTNFSEAVLCVLRADGLVIIDEFQRLLDVSSAFPIQAYSEKFKKISKRDGDQGCLWLVSNRAVDPEWTEPFHTFTLEPPDDVDDAIGIVLEAIGTSDAEKLLPKARHNEISSRFGFNPRALRLLGHLMRYHALEELIGPPLTITKGLALEDFADRLERILLMRAQESLSSAASVFLQEMSILPEAAPLGLLSALSNDPQTVRANVAELQGRFLIESHGKLRKVHPLVREVMLTRLARNPEESNAVHGRAGDWYAASIKEAVSHLDDEKTTVGIAGVRYHYVAAGDYHKLHTALQVVRPYLQERFSWRGSTPATDEERDAQISLLEVFLREPGPASVEYHLARLLEMRNEGDDLVNALQHSAQALKDQDFSNPWVQRLILSYRVLGPDAVIELGAEAMAAVSPKKGLFAVYHIYAAALNDRGRTDEAISLLLQGVQIDLGKNMARLFEQALSYAAAMPHSLRLIEIRNWAEERKTLSPQVALADVLIDERVGNWREGAERAAKARIEHDDYLHLALHEALCWLGAMDDSQAHRAISSWMNRNLQPRSATTWLAALISVRSGDRSQGIRLATVYFGRTLVHDTELIEQALISEWDTRVATLREPNPAFEFPVLPPSLSGLPYSIVRPQHGPRVLASHLTVKSDLSKTVPQVLAVGTEWASGHGGLSTFNRLLCIAFAKSGTEVTCIAIEPSTSEVADAKSSGVRLIGARPTPGEDERNWLSRRPIDLDDDYQPAIIVGHGRITGPAAARLAEDVFRNAKRLHFVHMAPDEIEWYKSDDQVHESVRIPSAVQAERRTQIELDLAKGSARAVAVGPRLYNRLVRDLEPYGCPKPLRLDPGFDPPPENDRMPPAGSPWKILLLGRAEDEKLKGLDIAASAVGKVARHFKSLGMADIELVVRGAKPDAADALRTKIIDWAGGQLDIVVRPYTINSTTLQSDMLSSSLVLMPSRSEGFGLVGHEAIMCGTPVLVSSRSGLSEMLYEKLSSNEVSRISVKTIGDDRSSDIDSDEWFRAIDATLRNRDAAFRNASALAKRLGVTVTWDAAVKSLLTDLW